MKLLKKLFGKDVPKKQTANVDWASIIYAYVTNLYGPSYNQRREDRARKECEDRGLAFGAVRITGGSGHSVNLSLHKPGRDALKDVREVLSGAIGEHELSDRITVKDGFSSGDVEATINDPENDSLRGQWVSGFSKGESYRHRVFLSISWHEGMEAHSEEALRVLLSMTSKLGFPPDAKHYAHESPVPIEDVVVYATRWEDPATKKRYLDALWHPELVRHLVYHGSNCREERQEGDLKGEVLASMGDFWPKISMNNRPVYSTVVKEPTPAMLTARQRIAERSVRRCDCGELATRQLFLTRMEMGDIGGTSSMGGISYACDADECLQKAQESPHLRVEVQPYKQEVWV